MKNYKSGDVVTVRPTLDGLINSYPAANWLMAIVPAILKEDAVSGTLDVYYVEYAGEEQAIYGFNIVDE